MRRHGSPPSTSAVLLAGCSGSFSVGDLIPGSQPAAPAQSTSNIGEGKVKVGLILPLSASGNAAVAAQSMRNAAEMALAEFNNPDIQLLVKDDGGSAPGAQQAAQQALDEGAEIILGPLFALTVGPVGQLARARNIRVIAFSTDANVAVARRLSAELPARDPTSSASSATPPSQGKRSFAALIPDNAYGTVAEAAFKQAVGRRGGRVIALERYPFDRAQMAGPGADRRAGGRRAPMRSSSRMGPTRCRRWCRRSSPTASTPSGCSCSAPACGRTRRSSPIRRSMAPGMRAPTPPASAISPRRYRSRYGQDPVRTASLAYDAVALVAALVKTQGAQRFSEEVLTNSSGFTGIDGLFRFRPDGTNQRGLAVMRVVPRAARSSARRPRPFGGSRGGRKRRAAK